MRSSLTDQITTVEEKEALLEELELLKSSLYTNEGKGVTAVLDQYIRPWVREYLNSESKKSGKSLDKVIHVLEENIGNISVAQLTLAYEPTFQEVQLIHSHVKSLANSAVLLEILYDPHLWAGATLALNGKYIDFSLREQLTKTMQRAWKAQ
jgi:F0F1-type ATP synthase delta subunit